MPPDVPILIDCDTGVDDALALMLAAHSPQLKILGVTTVAGNISSAQAASNTAYVLRQSGRGDVPVLRGAPVSLGGREPVAVPHIHGVDGLGGCNPSAISEPATNARIETSAIDCIVDWASRLKNQLTIVATGPLTNIALAIRSDPRAMRSVGRFVVMGGALRLGGNVTPRAEFNSHCDPLAFSEVMSFGIPITLFPLDVTQTVELRASMFDETQNVPPATVNFIRRISATYRAFHCSTRGGIDGCYVHDALTIAWLLDPTLATLERGRVTVDLAGEDIGRTHWTPDPAGHVDTAIRFDSDGFFRLFWGALATQSFGSHAHG